MSAKQRSVVIAFFHAVLILISLVSAWLLRFEFRLPNLSLLLSVAPIVVIYRVAAMGRYSLLHGYWKHTSVHDLVEMIKAIAVGSVALILTIRFSFGIEEFPLSIYFLEALVTSVILLGVRVMARVLGQRAQTIQPIGDRRRARRVLIAGAGFSGQLLIQELKRSDGQWEVVGCVDDDKKKIGAKVHGVPVLGNIEEIPALSAEHRAFEVLIAIPSATSAQMQRIVEICDHARLRYKTVPSLRDFIAGQPSLQQLREVNLEDLLGRDPIKLDLEPVRRKLKGSGVLVTGAAGSIGSELVHQVLQYEPTVLVCVDQDETGLFDLQQRLGKLSSSTHVEFRLADVTNRERMRSILSQHQIATVFHAAAYKHVSLSEQNLHEVLENNVLGLLSMLDLAEEHCSSSFVLISSDKAVNPTSFMGCTKRIGELILAARPAGAMRCVTVRFGNVLGSQGSVVPLFQKQIRTKKRITITDPDVTRYFMTIPEAVSLVLQAFVIGEHTDLMVLDMGKPLRIVDVARSLIKLSGLRDTDVKIEFTGLRFGEKLHEELFYSHEERRPTSVVKVTRAKGHTDNWNMLSQKLDELLAMNNHESQFEIRSRIKSIVPEYDCLLEESAAPDREATPVLRVEAYAAGAD